MAKRRSGRIETRGRKPLPPDEKHGERIFFRVTTGQRERIEQLAAQNDLTVTEWVRKRALGEL